MYNFKGLKEPVSVNPLEQWKTNQDTISKELHKYHASKVLSIEQQNHLNQILELPLIDELVVSNFRVKCRWRSYTIKNVGNLQNFKNFFCKKAKAGHSPSNPHTT